VPWTGPADDPVPAVAERLGIEAAAIRGCVLLKRSVDARGRPPRWLANYRVDVEGEAAILARRIRGVRAWSTRDEERHGEEQHRISLPAGTRLRPIVVGAGPAGLFAALRFAEAGAAVLLLERGGTVEARHPAVRDFWRHRQLDPECNVVYGEGGAGAFSDGKIYTRRRDGDLGWIFRRLVDFGADPEILEEGWAHLGTDRVREILPRLRARLVELGAEIRFDTAVRSLVVDDGRVRGVVTRDGATIEGAPVVVATGHSARDVYDWLLRAGASAVLRPMHIGARIEHPQKVIDVARYGTERGELPPASYRFVSQPPHGRARSAHTFCMCPGGTVVPASNHPGRVVVNGMSYSGRKAPFANSAIIVEVAIGDLDGTDPLAGVRFQDEIEARAFQLAGGDFKAPGQRVEDFLAGRPSTDLPRVSFPMGATPVDLREVLPAPIVTGMMEAIRHFDRRLPGFAGPEGVLLAPETRTTAPLRFDRDERYESPTVRGLMPVGEGAGYAGGIISAALDGLRAAESAIADPLRFSRSAVPPK